MECDTFSAMNGWYCPDFKENTRKIIEESSAKFYGKPAMSISEGGSLMSVFAAVIGSMVFIVRDIDRKSVV